MYQTVLRTKSDCKFGSDKSYLIAGGFGGLGRSTARWLAQRGAKYLVLLSRSGPISTTSVSLVKELETMGVYVHAPACDITDFSALSSTISSCAKNMPPVRGVIQASMVLQVRSKNFLLIIKPADSFRRTQFGNIRPSSPGRLALPPRYKVHTTSTVFFQTWIFSSLWRPLPGSSVQAVKPITQPETLTWTLSAAIVSQVVRSRRAWI